MYRGKDMYKILMMPVILLASLTASGQSKITVHLFLPGGSVPARETELLVKVGAAEERMRTDRAGKLEIPRRKGSNPLCRIAVRTDKRNHGDTDLTFRILDDLVDTPLFLSPLEMPKFAPGGRGLEAFDSDVPAEAREAYNRAREAGGNTGLAISLYTRAISLHPRYLRAINHLGMLYYERGRMDEAAAAFAQALSLGSSYPYPAYNLGAAWLQKGQLGQAIEVLVDLTDKNPGLSEARFPLSRALISTQQWDEAALQLKKMLEDPELPKTIRARGHIELSKIYTREERYQSAFREAQLAAGAQPDGPEGVQAKLLIGSSLFQLRRFDEAEKYLLEAYELDGKIALTAQLLLGQIYYEERKLEAALKAFELYLRTAPASENTPLVRKSIEMIRAQMKQK